MRTTIAQLNPTVGDIAGNTNRILNAVEAAKKSGSELLVCPELAVFGYPPRDLLLHRVLVDRNVQAVRRIAGACGSLTAIVGFVQPASGSEGKGLFNAAAVCQDGRIVRTYAKRLLPTYDVFDEWRYFDAGKDVCVVPVEARGRTWRVGLSICEDLWNDHQFQGRRVYGVDPIEETVRAGAEILVNLSASPFRATAQSMRESIFSQQIRAWKVPLVCAGQVGGNDDLIFDGASMVMDPTGRVAGRAKPFEEDLLTFDLERFSDLRLEPYPSRVESIEKALVLGIRDYAAKCGFTKAVIGLSGGIDSALTAVLAVEALGNGNVYGVAMPSRFSSDHSVEDARILARNLGIAFLLVPIEGVHRAMEEALADHFRNTPPGAAEENLQARIRGNILMALSNKFGWLPLATGNKSELAVGYCTLYGDMSGGVAVLSDVPKTTVYDVARQINSRAGNDVIPKRTIDKPPSAELRADQFDADTLPTYDLLDTILARYIERHESAEQIIESGLDADTVRRVIRMVDAAEYKRNQAPLGFKVTSIAFGRGRRMPIAAKYH